ncbi:MAG: M48 family metalloprotease [Archangium sp.]
MTTVRELVPVAFHEAIADELERSEPGLWRWIASDDYRAKHADAVKLELLRSTYRLTRETHEALYGAFDEAASRLGVEVPRTLYQAQRDAGLNAALVFLPGEAHVVLSGPVHERLSREELVALFGHELAHFKLFSEREGRFRIADELLHHITRQPAHAPSHANSARRAQLWAEFYADRGSVVASGSLHAAVSCLVKMQTGINAVDAPAYLAQADEALGDLKGSRGDSHPEGFLRAWALKRWHEAGSDDALELHTNGPLSIETLDLVQQRKLTEVTRSFIARLLEPEWMQTDAVLAHARRYFPEVDFAKTATNDAPLPTGDTSLEEYFAFVMLDFAMADEDLEDRALSRMTKLAVTLKLEDTFTRVARRELRLSAANYTALTRRLDEAEVRS